MSWSPGLTAAELGGSEYQRLVSGLCCGPVPRLDLDLERRLQAFVLAAAKASLLHSAHDCAEGGLLVTLAEAAMAGVNGVEVEIELADAKQEHWLGILFGETQSRFH